MLLLSSADFFKNIKKKYSRNTIRVSNGLDPDQDRRSGGPDLGPICLEGLRAGVASKKGFNSRKHCPYEMNTLVKRSQTVWKHFTL